MLFGTNLHLRFYLARNNLKTNLGSLCSACFVVSSFLFV
jgi:hypothetical protein